MKQKIYIRDGRRFVEVVDPISRIGIKTILKN